MDQLPSLIYKQEKMSETCMTCFGLFLYIYNVNGKQTNIVCLRLLPIITCRTGMSYSLLILYNVLHVIIIWNMGIKVIEKYQIYILCISKSVYFKIRISDQLLEKVDFLYKFPG